MLAQIYILFALVSAVLSAKNLREEPALDKHAAVLFHGMMKHYPAITKSGASLLTKLEEAAVAAEGKKTAVTSDKAKLAAEPYGMDGYLVERSRPNSDCSGVSVYLLAAKLGCRSFSDSGFSSSLGCRPSSDGASLDLVYTNFDSPDCTGEPSMWNGNPAMFEYQKERCTNGYRTGDSTNMVSYQCAPNALQSTLQAGGIVRYGYDNAACQGPPGIFQVKKFGDTCEQVFQGNYGYSPYSYVMLTGCTHDGMVTMSEFTDPKCERPVRTYQYDIRTSQEYGYSFNRCADSVRTECIPAPAHHN